MSEASGKKIIFYGTAWCPDCKRVKKLFGEHDIHYEYINIEKNKTAAEYVEKVNHGLKVVPTIVFPNKKVLADPTNEELCEELGLEIEKGEKFWDLIIIGGGPAGLTAGLYAAKYGIETAILERNIPGGEAYVIEIIDNYPGFPDGISGHELSGRLVKQAEKAGAEIINAEVENIKDRGLYKSVKTSIGTLHAKAVIIATGSDYMRLRAPGENELIGKGVHFCAPCDGPFYKDKNIVVVGGGNTAFEEAIFLSKFADHVTIFIRGELIIANDTLQTKVRRLKDKISLSLNTEIAELKGTDKIEKVILKHSQTGELTEAHYDGIFVSIGLKPHTEFLKDSIELDERGFIKTKPNFETNIPGVFASGNNRSGAILQLSTAVGEGTTAALMAKSYLDQK